VYGVWSGRREPSGPRRRGVRPVEPPFDPDVPIRTYRTAGTARSGPPGGAAGTSEIELWDQL